MVLTVDELKQELSVLPEDAEIELEVEGNYKFAQGVSLSTDKNRTWVTISDFPGTYDS